MTGQKTIIIDGENHLLGRLATVVAKQLLLGRRIVVVRCEGIVMSGKYKRMHHKYQMFLRKRVNTNPRKGPFHFRSPARMLSRVVRGMLPSRTERGKTAHARLETFVGVPPKYAVKKRLVVPRAHRILALKPGCEFNRLGLLAKNFGWKYSEITEKLERKHKTRSDEYYNKKCETQARISKAKEKLGERLAKIDAKIREMGVTV